MPIHVDFQNILDNFIKQYGTEKGKNIYYAYLHNENLDDTKSLESQKGYTTDKWFDSGFSEDLFNKHINLFDTKFKSVPYIDSGCGCGLCETDIKKESVDKIYFLKKEVKDAITGNNNQVLKSVENTINSEKARYSLIIEKWIQTFYDQGIQEAAKELEMDISEFGNRKLQQQQIKVLQENTKTLSFSLLDDINKEVGLLVTDIELNNIPISNTALKKEIQSIFNTKLPRLQAQITTETGRATNTGLIFGYKKSGVVTHKQWVAVIDDRTSSICSTLNGEIVEIGKSFSLGVYSPPAHPNCRSRVVPITISKV